MKVILQNGEPMKSYSAKTVYINGFTIFNIKIAMLLCKKLSRGEVNYGKNSEAKRSSSFNKILLCNGANYRKTVQLATHVAFTRLFKTLLKNILTSCYYSYACLNSDKAYRTDTNW